MSNSERVAYYNGKFMPESQVRIPFRDSAAIWGVGVHDTARTFNGRAFKLREHLERLWRNMTYLHIELPVALPELEEISLEVVRRNLELFPGETRVTQRASRGELREPEGFGDPTLIVECSSIPFAAKARDFVEGVRLVTPTVRRTPAWAESPRAKTVNRLNLILAQEDVWAIDPKAWALLTDENGNLAEGRWYNVFIVQEGKLITPQAKYVLSGITRDTTLELAEDLDIPVEERDIDLYEAYNADEFFIASTSVCICPVASLNGVRPLNPDIPGPVTRRLQDAFSELVGVDFVAQYLDHLSK